MRYLLFCCVDESIDFSHEIECADLDAAIAVAARRPGVIFPTELPRYLAVHSNQVASKIRCK
jgi:hypothetical protein